MSDTGASDGGVLSAVLGFVSRELQDFLVTAVTGGNSVSLSQVSPMVHSEIYSKGHGGSRANLISMTWCFTECSVIFINNIKQQT